jgi:hypothetical protein
VHSSCFWRHRPHTCSPSQRFFETRHASHANAFSRLLPSGCDGVGGAGSFFDISSALTEANGGEYAKKVDGAEIGVRVAAGGVVFPSLLVVVVVVAAVAAVAKEDATLAMVREFLSYSTCARCGGSRAFSAGASLSLLSFARGLSRSDSLVPHTHTLSLSLLSSLSRSLSLAFSVSTRALLLIVVWQTDRHRCERVGVGKLAKLPTSNAAEFLRSPKQTIRPYTEV